MMPTDSTGSMRTTITLDDDVAMDIKEYSHQHNLPITVVVNAMLRRGLDSSRGPAFTAVIDPPVVDLGGAAPPSAAPVDDDPDGEIAQFLRVTREALADAGLDQP